MARPLWAGRGALVLTGPAPSQAHGGCCGAPPRFPLLAPAPTPAAGRACSQPAPCPGLLGPLGPRSPPLWWEMAACAMTSPCRVLSSSPRLGATPWGRPHSRDHRTPPRVICRVRSRCHPTAAPLPSACPAFLGSSQANPRAPSQETGTQTPARCPPASVEPSNGASSPASHAEGAGPEACGLAGAWTEAAATLRTAGSTGSPLRPTAVRASLPVAGRTPAFLSLSPLICRGGARPA